jgi:phosphoglycolate phosphatase-like HAD superfamily hydrolase
VIKNIIWDLDGTLFDTYPAIAWAFKAALKSMGKEASAGWIEELARKSLGFCVASLVEKFKVDEEKLGIAFDNYYGGIKPEGQRPFPGVKNICKFIFEKGGKNFIVTHRGRESTDELLSANNMTHYFTEIITNENGFPKKPDPTAFMALINDYKLVKEETIGVGDREIDIQAGKAAGLFTCLLRQKENNIDADLVISKYDELFDFIFPKKPS